MRVSQALCQNVGAVVTAELHILGLFALFYVYYEFRVGLRLQVRHYARELVVVPLKRYIESI